MLGRGAQKAKDEHTCMRAHTQDIEPQKRMKAMEKK